MRNRFSVRRMIVIGIVVWAGGWTEAMAEQPMAVEPYWVSVVADQVLLRSGPGEEYYPTQQLPRGAKLQVYRDDGGDWLAVRPPEGSFSLVAASAIEPLEADLGRLVRAGVASRIGSWMVDQRDTVQVRLEQGELVTLLEPSAGSRSGWYRIAPPAGEFRWIRAQDVRRQGNGLVEQVGGDDEQVLLQPAAHQELLEPKGLRGEQRSTQSPLSGPEDAVGSFRQRVDQLEIQLARRLAGPMNLWVFEDLERKAAQLVSEAVTPQQTAMVHELADRLQRFSSLTQRQHAVNLAERQALAPAAISRPVRQSEKLERLDGQSLSEQELKEQFDAVGTLRPVVSKRGNAPPYALVDEQGEIVTFLTPSPRLNLQQHVGERVGVSGMRGYVPEYRFRNIQTAQVKPLAGATRR